MLTIQINDYMKWLHVQGPEKTKEYAKRVYPINYVNVFYQNEQLEEFLTLQDIDYQIDIKHRKSQTIKRTKHAMRRKILRLHKK